MWIPPVTAFDNPLEKTRIRGAIASEEAYLKMKEKENKLRADEFNRIEAELLA